MTSAETMMMRVLIVDDEPLGRDVVRHMLQCHRDVLVVGEAANGVKALEEIRAKQPDLVFLDIKMPKLGGLDMLKALPAEFSPVVVFTTAYNEYAVQAFERHALDYLLKPLEQERFNGALERVRQYRRNHQDADFGRRLRQLIASGAPAVLAENTSTSTPLPTGRPLVRLVVKDAGRVSFVPVDSVDWLEAAGNYVELHVGSKTHLIYETLAEMERGLDRNRFLRIHRSTIVSIDRIKELQPYANGEYVVILRDGTRLKLSRTFRERANEVLGLV